MRVHELSVQFLQPFLSCRFVDTGDLLLRKPGSLKVGRWLLILDSSSPVILKCVPWTSSSSITQKLAGNAKSQPHPRPDASQALGVGPRNPYLTSPPEDSDVQSGLN